MTLPSWRKHINLAWLLVIFRTECAKIMKFEHTNACFGVCGVKMTFYPNTFYVGINVELVVFCPFFINLKLEWILPRKMSIGSSAYMIYSTRSSLDRSRRLRAFWQTLLDKLFVSENFLSIYSKHANWMDLLQNFVNNKTKSWQSVPFDVRPLKHERNCKTFIDTRSNTWEHMQKCATFLTCRSERIWNELIKIPATAMHFNMNAIYANYLSCILWTRQTQLLLADISMLRSLQ